MKRLQWNEKWRYFTVMAACVVLNEAFYLLASALGLPMWLDMTGTTLAAVALEPAAGILVGLANNFFIAVSSSDASSILYFAASAAVAIIAGVNMRRENKTLRYRILTTILYFIIATTVIASLLTLLRSGGIPADHVWELRFYNMARAWNWAGPAACFFATFLVKVFDAFATAAIVALLYHFMPKALKDPRALRGE